MTIHYFVHPTTGAPYESRNTIDIIPSDWREIERDEYKRLKRPEAWVNMDTDVQCPACAGNCYVDDVDGWRICPVCNKTGMVTVGELVKFIEENRENKQ